MAKKPAYEQLEQRVKELQLEANKLKHTEETLRESEEKYRQLFELGSDALFLIEIQTGQILNTNNTALEMYGYSREEALQMKNSDFSSEPDKTRKATVESDSWIPVRYHRKKDGTVFPTEISVCYFTLYGKEVCVAAIRDIIQAEEALLKAHDELEQRVEDRTSELVREIEERKRAEEMLRQSEERYRNLVNNSNDIIATADKSANWTFLSPAVKSILGYDPEEMVDRSVFDFMFCEDISSTRETHETVVEESRKFWGYENRWISKGGRIITLAWNVVALRDEQGNTIGTQGIGRDITEQKQAEEALRETEERFQTVVETVTDAVLIVDPDGKLTYLNPQYERISGYPAEDLIGRSFKKLLPPENLESGLDRFKRGLSGEEMPIEEISILHKDGGQVPVEINTATLLDDEGKLVGRIGVVRDISERKRLEGHLLQGKEGRA